MENLTSVVHDGETFQTVTIFFNQASQGPDMVNASFFIILVMKAFKPMREFLHPTVQWTMPFPLLFYTRSWMNYQTLLFCLFYMRSFFSRRFSGASYRRRSFSHRGNHRRHTHSHHHPHSRCLSLCLLQKVSVQAVWESVRWWWWRYLLTSNHLLVCSITRGVLAVEKSNLLFWSNA